MDAELLHIITFEEKAIQFLASRGFISEDALTRMEIYKYYSALRDHGEKREDACYLVADRFCKSFYTINNLISQIEKGGRKKNAEK